MSETTTDITKEDTQRTQRMKNKILEGIEKFGGNITRACKLAGVAPSSYYRLCDRDQAFKDLAFIKTREAKESRLDELQDSLFEQATGEKPNVIAAIYLSKFYGRTSQDPSRQFNDTPLPEVEQKKPEALPLDGSDNKIKDLLKQYITDLKPAEQSTDTETREPATE